MKKVIPPQTTHDLADYPIREIVNGWFFRVNEISQGYYRVEGVDKFGHSVSRDGIDPDQLLIECRTVINEIFPS